MKFSKIFCVALAACMLAGGADAMAQKRKAAPRKATTTARKGTAARKGAAASRAVTGPAINSSEIVNKLYCGFIDFDANGLWCRQYLTLEPNDISWKMTGTELGGSWNVSGNALNVKSKSLYLKMKSPDGGNYFTGKFIIGENGTGKNCKDSFLYLNNIDSKSPVDTAAVTKKFLNGGFKYFGSFDTGGTELGAPLKVKLTPGENPNEGTYKITSDNEGWTKVVGVIRGTYKFDEEGLHLSDINGGESTKKYLDLKRHATWVTLGDKSIATYGTVRLRLYLFSK